MAVQPRGAAAEVDSREQVPADGHSGKGGSPRLRTYALTVVSGCVLLAFAPVLRAGAGFAWDDQSLIANNAGLRAEGALWRLWLEPFWTVLGAGGGDYYRPLVTSSYWLQWIVMEQSPRALHGLNVVLHLACALLVFRWLGRRVPHTTARVGTTVLWLTWATCWFAIHPARPENVAWVAGRTDLMALLFSLLAIECWRSKGRWVPWATGGLFLLALVSKEIAAFILVPWCADAWLLRPTSDERTTTEGDGLGARLRVSAVVGCVFVARLFWLPPSRGLATRPEAVLSALGLYVRETVAPFPPSAIVAPDRFDAAGAALYEPFALGVGVLLLLAVVALGLGALSRPRLRPWAADVLWFAVPLLPVLQAAQLNLAGQIAERFLYVPHMGVAALLVRAGLGWQQRRQPRPAVVGALAALQLTIFAPFTYTFAGAFRSDSALWHYELAVDPERAYVLERVEAVTPPDALSKRQALNLATIRVAKQHGQHGAAARAFVRWLQVEAAMRPQNRCHRDLLESLRKLEAGQAVALPLAPPLSLQLPLLEARRMGRTFVPFFLVRAELCLQCGDLQQAASVLASAPAFPGVAALQLRLLARRGEWRQLDKALTQALHAFADAPVLNRERVRLGQARQALELARSEPTLEALWTAKSHLALGDFAGALRTMDGAQGASLTRVEHHRARVEIYLMAHDPEGAKRALADARAMLPAAEAVWSDLAARLEPTRTH